jgi:hypothetical protein
MWTCIHCGTNNASGGSELCSHCGKRKDPSLLWNCAFCGEENGPLRNVFCGKCGKRRQG